MIIRALLSQIEEARMFSEEAARHELYERLRESIGEEAATTLMAQLPPFDWDEIATKRDLREFETRVVAQLQAGFRSELNAAVSSQTRTTILATLGSAVSVGTLVLAATQLG